MDAHYDVTYLWLFVEICDTVVGTTLSEGCLVCQSSWVMLPHET